jgi:integrase
VKIDEAQKGLSALKAEEGSVWGMAVYGLNRCAAIGGARSALAEVDFDRRLWTLPPERMKSAKQHVVPLSTAALAVLDRQRSPQRRRCFSGPVRLTALLRQLRHRQPRLG